MATGKVIGRVEVSVGNVKFVDVAGNLRAAGYGDLMYEGEQIYSDDVNALFQIKYLALPESTSYDGIFRVLADGSVISGLDGNENMFGDDIDFMETAAGDAGPQGSSAFLEEVPVDESSLLGFGRDVDPAIYGEGVRGFSVVSDDGDRTPPTITSANDVVFDENGTGAVLQVTATDTTPVTFSIAGLDSALFSIDASTGIITFNDSPDYENPLDLNGDNEYNLNVTVTDIYGNSTTQLVSINVSNLNDNVPTADDASNSATEDGVVVGGQLSGTDADGNVITYELVAGLDEGEGTLIFNPDGSYTYDIGNNFQYLGEGEETTITFMYKTVEVGPPLSEPSEAGPFESEIATVTIRITGTNDAPDANVESITKIADHITNVDIPSYEDGDVTATTYALGIIPFLPPLITSDAADVHVKTHGRYAVDDQNLFFIGFELDGDKEEFVDSQGFWNEGLLFDFDGYVDQVTIGFQAFGNHDRALVQLYDDNGDVVAFKYITSQTNLDEIVIDEGVSFSSLGIFALDSLNVTDFRITSISASGEMDTVLPFIIDDSMLLANDTDAEGDAIHVELVDGKLLDAGGAEIGTVTLTDDGDIQVTPDSDVDFDSSVDAYANFAYVVVDEHGAASEPVTATIDVALGTIAGTQIGYVADGPQEFIIGTDSDAQNALSDNVLTVSETLDLSHVSDINTIELSEEATVTGSAELGHITASDVIEATDLDNTLIIQSVDGNAHNQVNVHESFGDPSTVFNDGQWYAEYNADGATLLVEIDPPIDVV